MRIAFYAPLKPPDHPVPSGDRTVARLLMSALRRAGHSCHLVSQFCSYDGTGNTERQQRLQDIGARLALRLQRRWQRLPEDQRPELWFTYHVYHRAPDLLGPVLSSAMGIPYVVAEASFAPRQATGPWALGHAATARALRMADLVVTLNPDDVDGVSPLLRSPDQHLRLPPFVDARPFQPLVVARDVLRSRLCRRLGIAATTPLLLTVAMMRQKDKLASFTVLADAMRRLTGDHWHLLVVGDGPAMPQVRRAFAPLASRTTFLGKHSKARLRALCVCADLCVWPAVGEAWGMALLEAQAAGIPVVAGRNEGVASVVAHGKTGMLVPMGNASMLARAIAALLQDRRRLKRHSIAARLRITRQHDLIRASLVLEQALLRVRAKKELRRPCA